MRLSLPHIKKRIWLPSLAVMATVMVAGLPLTIYIPIFSNPYQAWDDSTLLISPDGARVIIVRPKRDETVFSIHPVSDTEESYEFTLPIPSRSATYSLHNDSILLTAKDDSAWSLLEIDIAKHKLKPIRKVFSSKDRITLPLQTGENEYIYRHAPADKPTQGLWSQWSNGQTTVIDSKQVFRGTKPSKLGDRFFYFLPMEYRNEPSDSGLYSIRGEIPAPAYWVQSATTGSFDCASEFISLRCVARLDRKRDDEKDFRTEAYYISSFGLYVNDLKCVVPLESTLVWSAPALATGRDVAAILSLNRATKKQEIHLIYFGTKDCEQLKFRTIR